ncbi:MAG: PPC domain-containing protein [Gemmatimonadaceae bacterium]
MTIPAGTTSLTVTMSGGTGDADLYVRALNPPTLSTFDCRPYRAGNNEECVFANPVAGTWHVMLDAYEGYTGVSLRANWVP